ncbi:hypothetical protein BAUCODRAFT_20549 [Baudoinia panamericana UAMH 10762]|uniref:Uncharacterized protein n=1 Tax=Baudoinia panamericana (strain UAMH 10762) TaxID=717646 RepID=M2N8H8_BAUPA|nr:uncharacterized protein BAUCODRAFT_20549 [Baudoinia panamericana UAMH 10762]EMD00449.1 hypothetical protein BAUCODRAFT_20549 [Baudoinia panamericana UAMH 10762]
MSQSNPSPDLPPPSPSAEKQAPTASADGLDTMSQLTAGVPSTGAPNEVAGTLSAVAKGFAASYNRAKAAIDAKYKRNQPEVPVVEYRIMDHDKLPKEMHFKEPNAAVLYPQFLAIDKKKEFSLAPVHSGPHAYRGKDRASFPLKGGDASSKRSCHLARFAYISFLDDNGGHLWGSGSVIPNPDMIETGGIDPRCVRYILNVETQRPFIDIRVTVARVPKKNVSGKASNDTVPVNISWICFFDQLKKVREDGSPGLGLTFGVGKDDLVKKDLPNDTGVVQLAREDGLFGFEVQLTGPCVRFSDASKLAEWTAANKAGTATRVQSIIVALADTKHFRLYSVSPIRFEAEWRDFIAYARAVFFASAQLGSFWYYRLFYPPGINDASFPFGESSPPRWLVTKYRVKFVDDKAVEAKPINWSRSNPPPHNLFPDTATFAFETRLGLAHELLKNRLDLERAIIKEYPGLESGEMIEQREARRVKLTGVAGTPAGSSGDSWRGVGGGGQTGRGRGNNPHRGRGKPPGTGHRSKHGRGGGAGST